MKRILFTGMSGTGKSTLIRELGTRGYKAIDLDSEEWSHWVPVDYKGDPSSPNSPAGSGRDWVWREDRVRDLLDAEDTEVLFVSGCGQASDRRKIEPRKFSPCPMNCNLDWLIVGQIIRGSPRTSSDVPDD